MCVTIECEIEKGGVAGEGEYMHKNVVDPTYTFGIWMCNACNIVHVLYSHGPISGNSASVPTVHRIPRLRGKTCIKCI